MKSKDWKEEFDNTHPVCPTCGGQDTGIIDNETNRCFHCGKSWHFLEGKECDMGWKWKLRQLRVFTRRTLEDELGEYGLSNLESFISTLLEEAREEGYKEALETMNEYQVDLTSKEEKK